MRKLACALVALVPVVTLSLNGVAWAFQLSGTYETHIEHVSSIPSDSTGAGEHGLPVPIPLVESSSFHSSRIALNPKLQYGRLSLAGKYVVRSVDEGSCLPDSPSPANHPFPDPPPFESYYRWDSNSATVPQPVSGGWEHFWGTVRVQGVDITAGAKNTHFGTGATLGSDVTNDIIALDWSLGSFHITAGTGLWVPETSADRFSVVPPAPWRALSRNGLFAGAYLDLPERETEEKCKKRISLRCPCKKKSKSFTLVDAVVLTFKVLWWLAGDEESSEEKKGFEDSKKSDYADSSNSESRSCCSCCDYECEPNYEYYDCHDVVVYDPTPEEIREARVNGLTRFYWDRSDVNKPFNMLLLRGDFPFCSAGMGGVWFPILRRRLADGAPNLDPNHEVDNARLWLVYLHYRDKRSFAKAECSTLVWNVYPEASSHRERMGYHFFAEMGTVRGPFTLSVMAALASGFDREQREDWIHFPIHHEALAPYESLMFHRYGGGNLSYHGGPEEGKGMLSDGYAFAARLDYAAASNVNLWGSALWAHRLGKSATKFGQYAPSGLQATASQRQLFARAAGRSRLEAPDDYGYVSDGALGYECNIGADWRLTSALSVALQMAFWQPGAWFREAHQGLGKVHPQYGAAVPQPVETRAAVYGLSASVSMEF